MHCLRYVTVLHVLGRGFCLLFGFFIFFGQVHVVSIQVCRILQI
jgi:hypothetical protein